MLALLLESRHPSYEESWISININFIRWVILVIRALYYCPQTKFGQANIFSSMFQEFCSRGRGVVVSQHALQQVSWEWYPSMPCRWYSRVPCRSLRGLSRPTPRREVEGSGQGVSRPTLVDIFRPTPGECESQRVLRQTPLPTMDGYCCRWYASYWNAFLFCTRFKVRSSLHKIQKKSHI